MLRDTIVAIISCFPLRILRQDSFNHFESLCILFPKLKGSTLLDALPLCLGILKKSVYTMPALPRVMSMA